MRWITRLRGGLHGLRPVALLHVGLLPTGLSRVRLTPLERFCSAPVSAADSPDIAAAARRVRLACTMPDPSRCSFQRWALSQARARGADVVVTGHTHLGLRVEHGDRLFLNSGTCSGGRFSLLSLDTRAGQYALHHEW